MGRSVVVTGVIGERLAPTMVTDLIKGVSSGLRRLPLDPLRREG